MMQQRNYIAVVDDDKSVRKSLPDLLRVFGHEAEAFSSAEEFLLQNGLTRSSVCYGHRDARKVGNRLQRELARQGRKIPIVFITAHGDEQVRQRLRQSGTVECS